jgi:hypothetical protein
MLVSKAKAFTRKVSQQFLTAEKIIEKQLLLGSSCY